MKILQNKVIAIQTHLVLWKNAICFLFKICYKFTDGQIHVSKFQTHFSLKKKKKGQKEKILETQPSNAQNTYIRGSFEWGNRNILNVSWMASWISWLLLLKCYLNKTRLLCVCVCVCVSLSVMSHSLWAHGL